MAERDDLMDEGDPAGTIPIADERPSHISEDGWAGLSEDDRDALHRNHQSLRDIKKNYSSLNNTVSELKGRLEGLMAGGVHNGNGHGNGNAPKETKDFSDAELHAYLNKANVWRRKAAAEPDDPEAKKWLEILGDGAAEEDARIELAARRALTRTRPELDAARAEQAAQKRAAGFHSRILNIVGPELMTGMLDKSGHLKEDHPVVSAAHERASAMLAERDIDPKNDVAVALVVEQAFGEVMSERRSRGGGGGRQAPDGRLEMTTGGAPSARGRGTAAAIATLLRQGKTAEAHDTALQHYFMTGESHDILSPDRPI